jgi:signal transduction histidine kinase
MTEAFFDAVSSTALSVEDPDLRNGAEIIDASARQGEMRARSVREVVLATLQGTIDTATVHQNVAALADRAANLDDSIRTHAIGPYAGLAEATFADPGVKAFNEQIATYLAGGKVEITPLLDSVRTTPDTGYTGLRARAANTLAVQADRIVSDADQRERLFLGAALLVVALAVLVTWLVSRSITRPLLELREQADDMAEHRLPEALKQILDTPMGEDVRLPTIEPVNVKTRDEVREVAAALNTVQQRALDLAVEQAVLRRNISDSYVNLGRRNQNLLDRQLEFITELESSETEPEALDELFRLDHLATRMRRNAESLLVLANVDLPRGPAAPVIVDDVVRGACGEVEDYKRVLVRALDRVAIQGSAASDIAHVLAELIENALTFSPPTSPVEVKGRLTSTDYAVAVIDDGIGMDDDALEAANRRLAGTESFTVAPSKYLGHYVAGNLANRHGIHVELQAGPAGGTIAKMLIPLALLTDEPVPEFVPSVVAAAEPVPAPTPEPMVPADVTPEGLEPTPVVVPIWNTDASQSTTPNGLKRRVAGAQRPDVPAAGTRLALLDDEDTAATGDAGDPIDDGTEPSASRPDEVYAFLSNFASGVERGRVDSNVATDEEG